MMMFSSRVRRGVSAARGGSNLIFARPLTALVGGTPIGVFLASACCHVGDGDDVGGDDDDVSC